MLIQMYNFKLGGLWYQHNSPLIQVSKGYFMSLCIKKKSACMLAKVKFNNAFDTTKYKVPIYSSWYN